MNSHADSTPTPDDHLPTVGAPPFPRGPTMSSREIADLCEARHNDVVTTIERLFAKRVLRTSRNSTRPYAPPSGGRPTDVYDLTQRDTYVVVAGYSDEVRARIIDRWMELEAATAARPAADPLAMLNDPAAMRGLLLTYSEKVLALEADRAAMAPKVEAHDRIAEAYGSLCVTDAAKTLQVPPKALFRWLRENNWIYRRQGMDHDVGYQVHITAGRLIHKVEIFEKPDGTDGSRTQVRVTPKGMTVLAKAFPPAATRAA